MLQTWDADADKRPSFSQLVSIIGDFLEANVKQVGVIPLLSEPDTVETCLYIVQAPLYIVMTLFTLESPLFAVLRTKFTLRGPSLQCGESNLH